MPLHDWTRATPGMFRDFHTGWLVSLRNALNAGRLPDEYYAMSEQRVGVYVPDVLAVGPPLLPAAPAAPAAGTGTAVAEPRTARRFVSTRIPPPGRVVSIRKADGNRVVAVIEIVSPGNKDRATSVGDFAGKIAGLVRAGIHAAVVDILPPGRHDPAGLHAEIWPLLNVTPGDDPPPPDQPMTFAGYQSADRPVAYVSYGAVGHSLPDVPVFIDHGTFADLPLEDTYMENYRVLPRQLRELLQPAPAT